MAASSLGALAADLESGRITEREARKRAAEISETVAERDPGALLSAAIEAYQAGRSQQAGALATIVDSVAAAWLGHPLQFWRKRRSPELALDLRARALALLSLLSADKGEDAAAVDLRQEAETLLATLRDSTAPRFAIGALTAERALRLGEPALALQMIERVLGSTSLSAEQRAAAQAIRAAALRAAGRTADAAEALRTSAAAFDEAGRPGAALDADLERGIHLFDAGDTGAARDLLSQVATSAAATDAAAVEFEARLRLGAVLARNGEHGAAAGEFEAAAGLARRAGEQARLIVALRNAADERRLGGDHPAAEKLLDEALAVPSSAGTVIDLAKAKVVLAVLRSGQGRQADAESLLIGAKEDLDRRLAEIGDGGSAHARDHIATQLRQIEAVRDKIRVVKDTNSPGGAC